MEAEGSSDAQSVQDDHTPLWKYVTKLEKMGKGGGNWQWMCSYCHEVFTSSYSRVKAHLMRTSGQGIKVCKGVKPHNMRDMQADMDQAEARVMASMPRTVTLPGSSASSAAAGSQRMPSRLSEPKRRRGVTTVEQAFNTGARDELDSMIARMFYTGGLSFNLARNPYFSKMITYAASNSITGYKPPGYNSLRTTLLQREKAHVERLLEPIRGTWKQNGVSICSNGWADAQRRPLINFIAVSDNGPMFLHCVNAEGEQKNKYFIAEKLEACIREVGPQNVIQIITDNASACKAAGAVVEGKFPHIFWTPCVVHTLNLALKNICAVKNTEANAIAYAECSWITEVYDDALMIKNFIMNHSMRLAMFNEHSKMKLLSIADTRFASWIIMLKRFTVIKRSLQDMVLSDRWSSYRDDDVGKAQFVKEKVLDDLWWDRVDYIIAFTAPIYDMIRLTDTDKPSLHLVYDMWDTMIEKVKVVIYRHESKRENDPSSFYDVVHKILEDRWNKSNTPLQCLAHSLNPRYYHETWLNGNIHRQAPHQDEEISSERTKCLRRYYPNTDERRMVNLEFAKFSAALDIFRDPDSLADRGFMDPAAWWALYGSSTPNIQALAFKLLGQPCSSSCCERNWSTYSFIHSLKRNKMTPERAEDLVYVHSNLRLLSRSSQEYKEGESKLWDIGGDAFDSFQGAGILDVATLSLDEPTMEAMLFADDEGPGNEEVIELASTLS
ncbi:uncharacterized protein LOC109842776 [Asparagus officinalis]|uniref:uncharacterized protein LOC109842776 n=1 Tax=Asparagus officinalis TaxID=4686 RepID=UPI00098E13E5|nr:uncharacterized protein LOC109842776 [Asparagus officinalis]